MKMKMFQFLLLASGALFLLGSAGFAVEEFYGLDRTYERLAGPPDYELIFARDAAGRLAGLTRIRKVDIMELQVTPPDVLADLTEQRRINDETGISSDDQISREHWEKKRDEFFGTDKVRSVNSALIYLLKDEQAMWMEFYERRHPVQSSIRRFGLLVDDLGDMLLHRLHWQSRDRPALRGFYPRFYEVIRLWNPKVKQPALYVIERELRQKVRAGLDEFISRFRRIRAWLLITGLGLLSLGSALAWRGFDRARSEKLGPYARGRGLEPWWALMFVRFVLRARDLSAWETEELKRLRRLFERIPAEDPHSRPEDVSPVSSAQPARSVEDNRLLKLKNLVAEFKRSSRSGLDPEAKALFDGATREEDIKERIRLVIEATALQKQSLASDNGDLKEPGPKAGLPAAPGVRYRQMRFQVMAGLKAVEELLPEEVDKEMAKAIITALFSVGRNSTKVESHHRRRSTLQAKVARYYANRLKKKFSKRSFQRTLRWLMSQGVAGKFEDREAGMGDYNLFSKNTPATRLGEELLNQLSALARSISKC